MKKMVCFAVLVLLVGIVSSSLAFESQPITAEIILSEKEAIIGHPFTVSYQLSGGSGIFNDVRLQAVFVHTSRNELGYTVGTFTSASDSCTFIPPEGESMRLMLHGSDSTGKEFYIHKNDIPILRNPDIPVSIEFDHSEIAVGETLTADYEISGVSSFENIELSWTILEENPEHPGFMDYSEDISPTVTTSPFGSVAYTPTFGDIIYLVIRGRDQEGNVFYEESNPVTIAGGETSPIICEFGTESDYAVIGHPYTIHYQLSGGSGIFNDVRLQAVFVHTSRNELGYTVGTFTSASDSCTFIPPEGESMRLMLHGSDSTGKEFYIHKNDIPILRNPDIPVSIEFDHSEIAVGETLTADYEISGVSSFENIELSWTILEENPEHPGFMDYSEDISPTVTTSPFGSVAYTPTFGDIIYLVIRGRDQEGNVFYEESKQIPMLQTGKVYLPESLKRIESLAFSASTFYCIVFPDTVEYIAEDAFLNSSVTIFEGGNAYVKNYAETHGYTYVD